MRTALPLSLLLVLACGEDAPLTPGQGGAGDTASGSQDAPAPKDDVPPLGASADTTAGDDALVEPDDDASAPDSSTSDTAAVDPDAEELATDTVTPADVATPACVPYGAGCEDLGAPPATVGKSKYPIVLVHGMGGFDSLGPVPYFVGVSDDLTGLGFHVFTTVTDPFNGSDVRAAQLGPQIDHILACTCAGKVNLIAHSQGGIDAKVLIDELGYGDRVAAAVTIASPFGGTAVADAILALDPKSADPLVDLLGGFVAGLYTDPLEQTNVRASISWCSGAFLAERFAKMKPDPKVAWFSYAGRAGLLASGEPDCEGGALPNPSQHTAISAAMLAGWTLLGGGLGVANDGLVPVASAKHGTFRGCVPADHMQEIGLSAIAAVKLYDHNVLYREIAVFLVSSGY